MNRALGVVATYAFLSSMAYGQPKRYERGHEFFLQARAGVSNEDLGQGYDLKLSSFGVPRVFPAKHSSRAANQFEFQYTEIQDQFLLEAHAKGLAMSGGMKASQDVRHMFIHAFHVKRVDKLVVEGKTAANSPATLVPVEIYYGWAADILVQGTKANFTAKARADLVKVGADLQSIASKNNLTWRVSLKGLKKKPGSLSKLVMSSPEAIVGQFEVAPTPVPIYVRYRALKPIQTSGIGWSTKQPIKRGLYRIEIVELRIKATKTNGKPWDAGWGKSKLPDPEVRLHVLLDQDGDKKPDTPAGPPHATAFTKNTLTPNCAAIEAKSIFLDSPKYIGISVIDKDLSNHDPVGQTSGSYPLAELVKHLGKEIPLPCDGAIESLKIRVSLAR